MEPIMQKTVQREFPDAPLAAVGAVVVDGGRALLIRRGEEPLKGKWSIPGGMLELGESLLEGVVREVREETGLTVEPVELIELLDRVHRDGDRVRYHYVIADYLCSAVDGSLRAASDADEARWVNQLECALLVDTVTLRVVEAGLRRAEALQGGN
jgi:8-oxo-dGTP diphosphatase